jgi:hypothetical protein
MGTGLDLEAMVPWTPIAPDAVSAFGNRNPLLGQFRQSRLGQGVQHSLQAWHRLRSKGLLDGLLPQRSHIRQTHAIGGQHPSIGMNKNLLHTQSFGNQAGMLAPGPAKAAKGIIADVIAPLHGDFFDGVGHFFHGNGEKTAGHLFGAAAVTRGLVDAIGQGRELGLHRFPV